MPGTRDRLVVEALARRQRLGLGVRPPVVPRRVVEVTEQHTADVAPPTAAQQEGADPARPGVLVYDPRYHLLESRENFDLVVSACADVVGVTSEEIFAGARFKSVVRARQLACYVAYQALYAVSTPTIGAWLGRDHTAVVYAARKVRNRYAEYGREVMAVMTKVGIEHGPDRLAKD